MPHPADLAVQLYSTRNDLGPRLGSTLSRLKDMGFTHVEPYDILGDTAALKAALEASGLKAATAHAKITELDRDAVLDAAETLGIGTVIVPYADPARFTTRDGVLRLAAEINEASTAAAARGIRVGYHNHDFEFSTHVDGMPAWELLVESLDPAVVLEVDTHWASVGGANVLELLPRHRDRVRFLHLTNEPPDEDDSPTLGVDLVGRMNEVVAVSRDFVELDVLEIVVDGDVFPFLQRNRDYFAGVLQP